MDSVRKQYQGVWNILRFNWHYYVLSLSLVSFIFLLQHRLSTEIRIASNVLLILIVCTTFISLAVSSYIYDFSGLYKLSWLANLKGDHETMININAGFDETSELLKSKFGSSKLLVVDFYDPQKHTEVSIKRARKAHPPFQGTQQISTDLLPMQDNSADKVFAILSAHEIRSDDERIAFFKEIGRVVKTSGQVIVVEHLRDLANFVAYNIGFLHFHSRAIWLKTFRASGLSVVKEIKITPFITTFILEKNGTAH